MGRVVGIVACVFFLLAGVLVAPSAGQEAEPAPGTTTTTTTAAAETTVAPAATDPAGPSTVAESATTSEAVAESTVLESTTSIVEDVADAVSTTTTSEPLEGDALEAAEAEAVEDADPVEEDPDAGDLVGAEPPAFDPDWKPEESIGVDIVSGELTPIDTAVAEDDGVESVRAEPATASFEVPDSGEVLVVRDYEFDVPVFDEREVRTPLDAQPVAVEGLPITVSPRAGDFARVDAASVEVQAAERGLAGELSEVGLAFQVRLVGFDNDTGVSDLVAAEGVSPILGEASGWTIEIDSSVFEAAPADMRDRLALRVYSGCSEKGECEISEPLVTTRGEGGTIVAEIPAEVLAGVGGPRRAAGRQTIGGIFEERSGSFAAMTNPLNVYFGVSSTSTGSQGNYAASALESLISYQVGLSTGYAESSYQIPVPPAVGPAPTVTFSYSSGAVDGMNTNANNQASQLGLGWSHATPVITRATRMCGSSGAEAAYEHNLCLPLGRHDGFSLSMNGVGGRLVRTTTTDVAHPQWSGATYQEYELENANGWRIRKVENAALANQSAAGHIPDRWGTWWEITTEDGTLHVFGRRWVIDDIGTTNHPLQRSRTVYTDTNLQSVQFAPAYTPGSGGGSSVGCDNDLCNVATAWFLDQTIDTHGNMLVNQYWAEENYFDAKRPGGTSRLLYFRSINLAETYYGRTFGNNFSTGNTFRVHYDYTSRADVPWDLSCAATGTCGKNSPSFFSGVRLGWVQTYALGVSPSAAGRWNLTASLTNSSDPLDIDKLQLDQIQRINPSNLNEGLKAVEFDYEMKPNRVNHPSGVPAMNMPRLETITNELGGTVTFTYGQPYPPIPGGSSSQPCSAGATPSGGYVRMPCNMFIAYDAFTGGGGFVLWNSYVVTKQTSDPNYGQSHTYEELTFTYQTPPNWRYSGTWGHTEYDTAQCKIGYGCNHWNDYRGHERVRVTDRAGNITEHFFYTGMREDRYSIGNPAQLYTVSGSAPEVDTLDPGLTARPNYRHLSGRSLGHRELTSGSVVKYQTIVLHGTTSIAGTSWPYARRDSYVAEYPGWFGAGFTGGSAGGKITTFFNSYSQVERVVDEGHRYGHNATTADDVTTFYWYGANTTDWIVGLPYKIVTQEGALTAENTSAPYISSVAMRYDQNPYFGTPPQQGEIEVRNTQLDTATQRSERFTYFDNGRVNTEKVILPGTDAVTTYGYNSHGNLTSLNGPLSGTGDQTTFVVDPRFGAPTQISAPNGQNTYVNLDTYGRTEAVRYPGDSFISQWFLYTVAGSDPARVRTKSLNETGEYVWSWEFFDGFSRPIQTQTFAEDGAAINVVSTGYDSAGRNYWATQPYQETSLAGEYEGYSLTGTARTVWTYDTNGLTRTRQYDAANVVQIDSSTRTEGWQTTSTDGLGNTTISMVDVDGNLVSVTDANSQTTTYSYNDRGDLLTITDPQSNVITNTYANWSTQVTQMTDPDLGTITYDYDIAGRLASQTDARGNALHVNYNLASQPTELRLGGSSTSDPLVSEWDYDASGRLTDTTHHNLWDDPSTPTVVYASRGVVETSVTYDLRNRVTNKEWSIPDLPGGSQDIDYTYRQLGAIDTITYPNGTVVDYGYNKETEQPVSLTVDGTTVASGVRYNPAGQVEFIQRGQPDYTSADLAQLGTTYSYDYTRRISSISTVGLDEPDSTEDALIRLYRSGLGRDPDASGWGYWLPQYADGLPLANIAQVFHDSAEFPTSWTDTDGTTVRTLSNNFDFVMWMYGRIIDRAMGNRSGWSWWQNQLDTGAWTRGQAIAHFSNLAEAISNPDIGGTDATVAYVAPTPADADVPQELAYTWDDAGNLTTVHETSEGVDQWQCFTYDNLHRLDLGYIHGSSACGAYQAIGPDPFNVDYAYNSIGNITTASGTGTVGGSYTYSSIKPHAVTAAGSNSYAYDNAGNMTTRTTSIGTQTLGYDVLNRLVDISGAGDDMDSLYDADGVRVRRDLDGDTVFYLTDSYEIHDPAVGADTETIHFTLGGISVGSEVDGTLFASAADHLGSGSISRDNTGATDTQRYTPYGAIRGGGGNGLPTDFTFTGQTDDPGTGLIDYNARHYDPQLGRFIMADSVLDGLNRYEYVRSNPLRATDPTGHDMCPDGSGGCGGVRAGDANGDGYVGLGNGNCRNCGEELYLSPIEKQLEYHLANEWARQGEGEPFEIQEFFPLNSCWDVIATEGTQYGDSVVCGVELFTLGFAGRLSGWFSGADDAIRSADEILSPGGNLIGNAGSRPEIRNLTGGVDDARSLFDELAEGGSVVDSSYPGDLVRLENGGTVGFRTEMSNSPDAVANIDVNIPGIPIDKIKFTP